jgi:acyl-CoA synthetase (AMP-forming)/AMP-acid ligase II
LEYIAAFFGCLYAGATAVTVYPPKSNNSMPRLRAIINNSQAAAAVTTGATLSKTDRFFSRAPELKELKWLSTDGASEGAWHDWREPAVSADTLAMLQYTSGSTTTPKGVMLTHENLMHNQRMIASAFGGGPDTIVVGWLPLFHDMGLIGNVIQPMYLGGRCVMMSPVSFLQNPARWLEAMSRYRATTSGGPNFAYDLCVSRVSAEQRATLDLSSWRVAFNGAEPVRCRTLEQFASAFAPCGFSREAFYPCYGLAEATLMVTGAKTHGPPAAGIFEQAALEQNRVVAAPPNEAGGRKLPSCGRPFPNQRVAIVNPESLAECPPNEVGEIWVSGPNVARGYWGLPDETRRTFGAYLRGTGEGPFLRTGDLGFLMDGELFVTGRLKDVIIIRGRNHYPQDIELTVEQTGTSLQWGRCAAFSVDEGDESRLVVVQELARNYRDSNLDEVINNGRSRTA